MEKIGIQKYPAEQPAVRTTIVGGRPPGPGKGVGSVPRGIEVLVKKGAVDPKFRDVLLARRSAAAAEIGLGLSSAEAAVLDGVPAEQLEAIIANTTVSPKVRPAFMGRAAAVMLAALGTTVVSYAEQVESNEDGNEAEEIGTTEKTYETAITDSNEVWKDSGPGGTGIRPDLPIEPVNLKNLRVEVRGPIAIEGPGTVCVGRSEGWINNVVWQHLAGIRYIYTRNAKVNSNVRSGEITFQFTISADGSVTDATVLTSTMDSPDLENELITRVYLWQFPVIEEGEVTVTYPFEFVNLNE